MTGIDERNNWQGLKEVGPVFSYERDLYPVIDLAEENQAVGPVDNFTAVNKMEIREQATETGRLEAIIATFAEYTPPDETLKLSDAAHEACKRAAIENGMMIGPFQHCAPFDNLDHRKLRQEILRVKGISTIFNEVLTDDTVNLEPENQAIRLYVDTVLNQAVLVEAARRDYLAITGQGKDDPEFCRRMIRESLDFLYPKPTNELASKCLSLFSPQIEKLESGDVEIQEYGRDLLKRYPFLAKSEAVMPEVLSETRQDEIKEYLATQYQPAFNQLRTEFTEINNEMLAQVAQRLFELLGYSDLGWKCEDVGDKRAGFKTDPANRILECGKRRKEITWPAFERLMIHEVGVHATRAVNPARAGIKTLENGLAGYEDAEEGLAILFEKVWAGTAAKQGAIDRDHYRYLIGCYAAGQLDGAYHGPQETFDFAVALSVSNRFARAADYEDGKVIKDVEKEARSAMFEHVFRLYRGMPDGCIMLKDLSYFAGTDPTTKLFNSSDDATSDIINRYMRGKYNFLDPLQDEITNKLYAAKNNAVNN
jgi:hypothetical protein